MNRTRARFRDEIVLITGASSGIGAALAIEMAREGADIALLARRTERLEQVAGRVRELGRRAAWVRCDVARDGDVDAAVQQVRQTLGALTVVVANAGFEVAGPIEHLEIEDYRRQFETNVLGVVRTVRATLPDLKRCRGRLALIGSVAGYVSLPGAAPYAMSKFAVRALAQALRHELAPSHVSVTLISPGFVDSELRHVDNQGVYHPDSREPAPRVFRMRTAPAARRIVRAIAARRREVVITWLGKLVVFFARHAPWLVDGVLRLSGVRGKPEPS